MKESCKSERFNPQIEAPVVRFEELEGRLLLAVPTFGSPLPDHIWVPATGGGRTLGIDGVDTAGTSLTITATSDNPLLDVMVPTGNRYAKLHFVDSTNKAMGDILVQLFDDRSLTAVNRFVTLATDHVNADKTLDPTGVPFYHDVLVHRVIPGFMIQTGDAVNGTGTGGSPLGAFNDSFNASLSFAGPGVLAMANSGVNTNDCQFFITDAPTQWLDNVHMIFGQVISGMSTLDQIINLPRDNNDRPNNPPKLQYVQILNSPQDGTVTMVAKPGLTGEAHVTIKLDDGQGGVTTKVITVRSMADLGTARPTIVAQADKKIGAGATMSFNVTVTDDGTLPITVTGQTDMAGATVVVSDVDATTKHVTVTAPANYTGLMKVYLSGIEAGGWDSLQPGTQSYTLQVIGADDMDVLSRIAAPSSNSLAGATVKVGNYLYTAMGSDGVFIYNVTDPAHPFQVGTYNTTGSARDIKVVGHVAYVADLNGGLVTLDVTNPAAPTLLGKLAPPAVQPGSQGSALAISLLIDGNTAWVADYGAGITGYDISNPGSLTRVADIQFLTPQIRSTAAVGLVKKGNYLLVSDAVGVVFVLDVTTPASWKYVSYFGYGYGPWDIKLQGNTLYMAGQKGISSWDVSNLLKPRLLGKLAMTGTWMLTLANDMAIVARQGGYSFVDIKNPKKMVEKQQLNDQSIYANNMIFTGSASVDGTVVAIPFGGDGVMLLDGTLGATNGSFSFRDGSGVLVTVSVANGTAKVDTANAWGGAINSIDVIGSPSTTVTITTSGGLTTVGGVTVTGSLKSFTAKTVNLGGNFTVSGSLESLAMNNVGDELIKVQGTAAGAKPGAVTTYAFNSVNDASIDSALPIKSLTVNAWSDNPATPDSIVAPSIAALTSKGNLPVPLDLSGAGNPQLTLGSAKITGNTTGAQWKIKGAVGSVSVAGRTDSWTLTGSAGGLLGAVSSLTVGDVSNVSIDSAGAIAKVTAKRWLGGTIAADSIGAFSVTGASGLAGNLTANVDTRSIKSISVKGDMTDSIVTLSQAFNPLTPKVSALGSLTVGGHLDSTEVRSAGNIGSVTAGVIRDSVIFAGVKDTVTELPAGAADFSVADPALLPKIASVTAKGLAVRGQPAEVGFVNSVVGAWTISKASLKTVQTDNSANANRVLGLAGHTVGAYLTDVTQGDFQVRVI